MLPKMSGIDVCRELRSRSTVPIIMVTAKGSEIDTVVGLEVGADDYVSKPYRLRELVARMRAVLRRRPIDAAPLPISEDEVVTVGDVTVDHSRHEVTIRDVQVRLPLKEFELLALLLENAGRVLTRDTLIDRVWGSDYVGDTKTLDVHIKRLRAKVEQDPARPSRIVTIRGLGRARLPRRHRRAHRRRRPARSTPGPPSSSLARAPAVVAFVRPRPGAATAGRGVRRRWSSCPWRSPSATTASWRGRSSSS